MAETTANTHADVLAEDAPLEVDVRIPEITVTSPIILNWLTYRRTMTVIPLMLARAYPHAHPLLIADYHLCRIG